MIIALLWERAGTEDLTRLGGLAMRAPVLAALFLIVTLATLAMPGSANFIGEFYILIGVFQAKIVYAFVAIDRGRVRGLLRDPPVPAHDAQPASPTGSSRARSASATRLVLAPLVACIVAPGALPGLILDARPGPSRTRCGGGLKPAAGGVRTLRRAAPRAGPDRLRAARHRGRR